MRLDHFEALAPLCPRCLHVAGVTSAIVIAERTEMRAGRLWHGILHCSNPDCWLEFPVVDGVPVITPDPLATLRAMENHLLGRDDLPEMLESLIGDALGPGGTFDIGRQHLSIYAGDHFADWTDPPGRSSMAETMATALAAAPAAPEGPALDIGCGPGRGGWEIARRTGRMTLGCDLNLSFLRLAQRLALDGAAVFPSRRIGLAYDRTLARLPEACAAAPADFWALDAQALPFPPRCFALTAAINVVDCVAAPAQILAEAARATMPGGAGLFTTPYDWSPAAVPEIANWFGGHSQRAAHRGAGEPVMKATLEAAGFTPVSEAMDLPWALRLHSRSVMHYSLHLVACTRPAEPA